MDSLQTHPSSAAQAKAFTAPGSFSFPNGHGNGEDKNANGNAVLPATPAATPVAKDVGSGLTPTLQ